MANHNVIGRLAALLLLSALASLPGHAQQQRELENLRDRLDASTFTAVVALMDSATASGLPTAPLVSKVQEGLLKRATPGSILVAARGLLGRLRDGRAALGVSATPVEIEAAASALKAGAVAEHISTLRQQRSGGPLTVPLVVLADLLSRGVPRDTAARAVQAMAAAHATDAAFNALRLSIERDITGGMSPALAAGMRYRAMLGRQP
jgi:hypothetical protein